MEAAQIREIAENATDGKNMNTILKFTKQSNALTKVNVKNLIALIITGTIEMSVLN